MEPPDDPEKNIGNLPSTRKLVDNDNDKPPHKKDKEDAKNGTEHPR